MSVVGNAVGDVIEVQDAEARSLFDRIARKNMGISGDEFVARWDAGEFADEDWDDVPGLVEVAMAVPLTGRQ